MPWATLEKLIPVQNMPNSPKLISSYSYSEQCSLSFLRQFQRTKREGRKDRKKRQSLRSVQFSVQELQKHNVMLRFFFCSVLFHHSCRHFSQFTCITMSTAHKKRLCPYQDPSIPQHNTHWTTHPYPSKKPTLNQTVRNKTSVLLYKCKTISSGIHFWQSLMNPRLNTFTVFSLRQCLAWTQWHKTKKWGKLPQQIELSKHRQCG